MTDEQIKKSIQTQKLHLTFWDKVAHFGIVLYLLSISFIAAYFLIKTIITEKSHAALDGEIILLIVTLVLSFLFYKIQLSRLKFKNISTAISREEVITVVKRKIIELNWTIEKANNRCIVAKTHPSFFSGSWGEQVTILFYHKDVLLNSICDPDKWSSVVSMGRNKQNVNMLIEEVKNAEIQKASSLHI